MSCGYFLENNQMSVVKIEVFKIVDRNGLQIIRSAATGSTDYALDNRFFKLATRVLSDFC